MVQPFSSNVKIFSTSIGPPHLKLMLCAHSFSPSLYIISSPHSTFLCNVKCRVWTYPHTFPHISLAFHSHLCTSDSTSCSTSLCYLAQFTHSMFITSTFSLSPHSHLHIKRFVIKGCKVQGCRASYLPLPHACSTFHMGFDSYKKTFTN